MENINNVLNAVKEVNTKAVYPIYVPSLKKYIMFRELTTGQEKAIVKTIVDNPVYNSSFIFTIRSIIKENCADVDVDIDQLTLVDKVSICLKIREKSVGDTFEYAFKGANLTKIINIADLVNKIESISIKAPEVMKTPQYNIHCSQPTIKDEYELEVEFHSNIEDLSINNISEMQDAIGNVFMNEICKYVKGFSILRDDGSDGEYYDLTKYDFKNRIQILEQFGNTTLKEILKYIKESTAQINDILTIELELKKADRDKFGKNKLTGMLEAGASFFMTS